MPMLPERFFAAGEEKTVTETPTGFGYPYKATDGWIINDMIHNLTPEPFQAWLAYDVDLVPATTPAAAVIRRCGRSGSTSTTARPTRCSTRSGATVPTVATPTPTSAAPADGAEQRLGGRPRRGARVRRRSPPPGRAVGRRVGSTGPAAARRAPSGRRRLRHLFRSEAVYWEPAGAVSWDVGMTATPTRWRVAVKAGDTLPRHRHLRHSRASWYESMGIVVVWMADGTDGADPSPPTSTRPGVSPTATSPRTTTTAAPARLYADPATTPAGPRAAVVDITGYVYASGDMEAPGPIPTVKAGQSFTFRNLDAPLDNGTWHTITACQAPCNASTGIAYPLADAAVTFDSGELGLGGPPTADRVEWATPPDLAPGLLHLLLPDLHPFMRGAFAGSTVDVVAALR